MGGGMWDVQLDAKVLTLNLITLEWREAIIRNRPHSFARSSASALGGGVITGGLQAAGFGMEPVPKLEFLCLRPPAKESEHESSEDGQEEEDSEAEEELLVPVRVRAQDGSVHSLRVPPHFVTHLRHLDANDLEIASASSSSSIIGEDMDE